MPRKEYAYRPSQAHLKRVKTNDGRTVINKAYNRKAARAFKKTYNIPNETSGIMNQFSEPLPAIVDALTGDNKMPFNADAISKLDYNELRELGLSQSKNGYYYMGDSIHKDDSVNFSINGREVYRANLNDRMQPTSFRNPEGYLMPAIRVQEDDGYHETSYFMENGELSRSDGLPAVNGPNITEYWDSGEKINGPGGAHHRETQIIDGKTSTLEEHLDDNGNVDITMVYSRDDNGWWSETTWRGDEIIKSVENGKDGVVTKEYDENGNFISETKS